jgi:hypothetical protein
LGYRDGMPRAGTGHIERLPSGSYRVHVYAGTDPLTGRQLRHRRTAKTEEQARIVLGRLLEQTAIGRRPESGATVADLLAQYMAVDRDNALCELPRRPRSPPAGRRRRH